MEKVASKTSEAPPFWKNGKFLLGAGLCIVAAATLHKCWRGDVNNFLIFRTAALNLLERKELYGLNPEYHFDLFKYSPTFALLMAPFTWLPILPGAVLWNLLNAGVLFFAGWKLPLPPGRKKLFLALIFIELLTSVQNNQSNGLTAGLFLLSFVGFEKGRPALATFFVALSAFIKIFGLAAFLPALLYPNKLKAGLYQAGWLLLLAVLPLLVVPADYLLDLYRKWFELVRGDQNFDGLSVMFILRKWFGLELSNRPVQLLGLALLILPLVRIGHHSRPGFRFLFCASLLVGTVIFNHKAESPMFVLALAGVALWYLTVPPGRVNTFLLFLTLVLTSLSSTDFFPRSIRDAYVFPYALKAVPCILVWLKIQYDLYFTGAAGGVGSASDLTGNSGRKSD